MKSEGHGERMTRKMEFAIGALLTQPTITAAAKQVGVNEATLSRWLKDETFARAYVDARRAALSVTTTQLQQASSKAVLTLVDVMDDPEAPASARVSAAKTTLEMATRAVELEDLAQRIKELELDAEAQRRREQRRRGR